MQQVRWDDWDDAVFERARELDRPILLYLKASWCKFCRELSETVFSDPAVVEEIEQHYVPMCVDKDRRPDVDHRYNLGGWPTVAFLTPDGDIITGGSDLTHDEIRRLIGAARHHFARHREELRVAAEQVIAQQEAVDAERRGRPGVFSPSIVEHVANAILKSFDRLHGGFGTGQKFPHPEAVDFAILHYAKTHNPAYKELVLKTLSAMAEGSLFDRVSGAFFRFCGTRDWRQPHTEVLLETNAGLLRNYLEAYQLFDRPDFKRVARKVVQFLCASLDDPQTGGFYGSQDADDGFYALSEQERRDRKPPRVERTCYTPSVAMAVSSLFKAGSVLEDPALRERALAALHFLLERCYTPGRGMYHYYDGSRHILGLLTDQIYTARALIHAIQYTGDNDYLGVLEDLITTIVKKQSATNGGFYDIPADDAKFGSLRRRNTSLLENGVMAEVLMRASILTGRDDYRGMAGKALAAFASDYQLYGYFTAGYARAVELYFEPPLLVVVVGSREDPRRQEMLEVAQRTYVPSKVVVALDPEREAEALRRYEFPSSSAPRAYICLQRACVAELSTPDEIAASMVKAAAKRQGH